MFDRRVARKLIGIDAILVSDGLTQELFEIVNHRVASIKVDMSENDLIIELTFANVVSEEGPPIESDAHVSSSLNQIDLVGIRLELEEHRHVVKVRVGVASRNVANCLVAPKK